MEQTLRIPLHQWAMNPQVSSVSLKIKLSYSLRGLEQTVPA